MISAPWACNTFPRLIALSLVRQTLSRYHESGERLITPMMAGRELNSKRRPPIENSFTRALAASWFFSNSSARCSSVSMPVFAASLRRNLRHARKMGHDLQNFRLDLSKWTRAKHTVCFTRFASECFLREGNLLHYGDSEKN